MYLVPQFCPKKYFFYYLVLPDDFTQSAHRFTSCDEHFKPSLAFLHQYYFIAGFHFIKNSRSVLNLRKLKWFVLCTFFFLTYNFSLDFSIKYTVACFPIYVRVWFLGLIHFLIYLIRCVPIIENIYSSLPFMNQSINERFSQRISSSVP